MSKVKAMVWLCLFILSRKSRVHRGNPFSTHYHHTQQDMCEKQSSSVHPLSHFRGMLGWTINREVGIRGSIGCATWDWSESLFCTMVIRVKEEWTVDGVDTFPLWYAVLCLLGLMPVASHRRGCLCDTILMIARCVTRENTEECLEHIVSWLWWRFDGLLILGIQIRDRESMVSPSSAILDWKVESESTRMKGKE